MTNEIIISGFGGQGVMAIGKNLAEAGMKENKNVSWLPSYGPEMRGGTANCSVVLSDEPIICPIVLEPTELIAMNLPSLVKFEPTVVKDGVVFVNSSIISDKVQRSDVRAVYVPCLEIANELGNLKGCQHGHAGRLYRGHEEPGYRHHQRDAGAYLHRPQGQAG